MVKAPISANELPSYAQCIQRRIYLRSPCRRLAGSASHSKLRMKGRMFRSLRALDRVNLADLMRWRVLL